MLERAGLVKKDRPQKRLFVEGPDDKHALIHLFQHHQIFNDKEEDNPFKIEEKRGIENILEILGTELKQSGLEQLGIVVDADTDIATRWQSLQNRLSSAGYTAVPDTPDLNGIIIKQEDRPTVGVWLMPNNTLPGMLEDFVSFLVRPDDALWPLAENVVQQVIDLERRFPENHHMKARIHTWLAWQEVPGTSLGLAVTRHYLDADNDHARQFIAWIRQLFDLK